MMEGLALLFAALVVVMYGLGLIVAWKGRKKELWPLFLIIALGLLTSGFSTWSYNCDRPANWDVPEWCDGL
jgi:hypothetical protein